MHLIFFKTLAACIILGVSLLAGWGPLRAARAQPGHPLLELGEALAGGVFLGIGLFHMLPDAEKNLEAAYGHFDYPYANVLCALGFVVLLFFEKVILRKAHYNHPHSTQFSTVPYVLPIVLSIHALIEGTALGINTLFANIFIIFVAIIAHKGSESFALASNLGRSHLPMSRILPIFLLWAMMSPLGVVFGSVLADKLQTHNGQVTAAVFNAFAAGTFLYIATLHKSSHLCAKENGNHFLEFLLLIIGLAIMAIVEIWL